VARFIVRKTALNVRGCFMVEALHAAQLSKTVRKDSFSAFSQTLQRFKQPARFLS
jgi:hypothetical protein